jgi:hypothetical protein
MSKLLSGGKGHNVSLVTLGYQSLVLGSDLLKKAKQDYQKGVWTKK